MNHLPICILSTKNLDKAIIQQAASENIFIDCIPFVEIIAIENDLLRQRINHAVTKNEYVIFTSKNAVKAVAAQLEKIPTWKIFCISGVTKSSVQKHFSQCEIIGSAAYGKELAKQIIQQKENAIVFFCGDRRLDTIPNELNKNQISFEEIIVYKTISTPKKIEKKYDGILFSSPSAVESFFSINELAEDVVSFAIGETTEKSLKEFCNNIMVAENADTESILKKVKDHYAN